MAKALLLGIVLVFAVSTAAVAQSTTSTEPAASDSAAQGGAGVRSGNITATGETVPNPGASQSAGTTDLDRGIQRQDNKIQNGICKGC